ncbi:hypothetical protein [Endozoicomonas euniceicola]|uniref:Uncharacterized protein n=1 Tax=Endozoicomonas euniceicola TaxID=1234143 RepID=A0ABY6H0Y4_9GAMM|nr:hypothetical protein [Endozoicomonas euniceicola]UYM17878.1 hypothetical protein NX720_08215 [Endozoicomonas euniceicola]
MIKKEVKLVLFILFNTLLPAVHANELPARFLHLAEDMDKEAYERDYGQNHEVVYRRNQRPYYRVDYIEKRLAAICATYNHLGRSCKSGVIEKRSVLFSWISVLPESQTPELRKWVSFYALQKLDNHAGGKPRAVQLEEIFYAQTRDSQRVWLPVLPYSSLWKDWVRQQERFYNKSCVEPEPGWERKERNRFEAANKSRAEENRLQLHYALHGLDPEITEWIQRQLKPIFPENAVHDLEPSKSYTLLLNIPGALSDRLLLPVNESFFALDSNGHLAPGGQKSENSIYKEDEQLLKGIVCLVVFAIKLVTYNRAMLKVWPFTLVNGFL